MGDDAFEGCEGIQVMLPDASTTRRFEDDGTWGDEELFSLWVDEGIAVLPTMQQENVGESWTALTLPALLLTGAAVLFVLAFPLRLLHLIRLRRYTALLERGGENKPMRELLKTVVIDRSVKNYGIRAVEFILRPFFFHRVRGAENVRLDEDIPCVFVCNHGEILGPVVCTLFSPFPFRPWSAYEMLDLNTVSQRTMDGTFQSVRGIGRRPLQWLMDHVGAPFLIWLLHSERCIPVYHDNPRKLMQTFRETITAMQAGDNILVFPENAATSPDHRYVQEGVSEFFTGFTMIEQDEAFRPISFSDTGALIWFAKVIPWEFAGFSVKKCFERLLAAERVIAEKGRIEGRIHRFYIAAQK